MRYVFMFLLQFCTFNQYIYAQFVTIKQNLRQYEILDANQSFGSSTKEEHDDSLELYHSLSVIKEQCVLDDSLLWSNENRFLELLSLRMNVALPLNSLRKTSGYGYRKDPISGGVRFHDGIDLRCKKEPVFSMLSGKVLIVATSKSGYGNHIVIQHGGITCTYGHLSRIYVKEGDEVRAGSLVALSGNSGKSTGYHLHIKLEEKGISINAETFLRKMITYLYDLNVQIAELGYGEWNNACESIADDLTIDNLVTAMRDYGVHNKRVVLAQAILETGSFTSRVCNELNNLFGLRRPSDGRYYAFKHWRESVKAYRDYVQYKHKDSREDYYDFLQRIGYAEDKNYIYKVKKIAARL